MTGSFDADVRTVPAGAIERDGARMILIDPDDRVLLIEERGSGDGDAWHHWLTPGGGVEAAESLPEAATREVIEETGLRVQLLPEAEPVYRQRRLWSWGGATYLQTDSIFAARVGAAFDVAPAALTPMEQQTVVGARWWSLDQLRASADTIIPADLAPLLDRLLRADALPRPVRRTAGRVLVLDRENRVLLINTRQAPGSAATNWVAPGGGIEAAETPAQAAVRELFEETGIAAELAADAPVAARERAVFSVGTSRLDQTDEYFCVRVDSRPEIDRRRLSELERATVLEYRWWSAAELAATRDTYWPADLVGVLAQLGTVGSVPRGAHSGVA